MQETLITVISSTLIFGYMYHNFGIPLNLFFDIFIGLCIWTNALLNLISRLRIIFFYFYLNIPIPYARKYLKYSRIFQKYSRIFHIDKAIILVILVL